MSTSEVLEPTHAGPGCETLPVKPETPPSSDSSSSSNDKSKKTKRPVSIPPAPTILPPTPPREKAFDVVWDELSSARRGPLPSFDSGISLGSNRHDGLESISSVLLNPTANASTLDLPTLDRIYPPSFSRRHSRRPPNNPNLHLALPTAQ